MAKAKAPIFYCKWCEEVMETDCQFCSQLCRSIWTKTRHTPTEEVIATHQKWLGLLKENRFNISLFCKDRYETIKTDLQEYSEGRAKKLATVEGALFAYIYNKKKDKALQAFEKFKRLSQDGLDECLFDGKKCGLRIKHMDGTTTRLLGDEAFRVDAMIIQLSVQSFDLMLQQTFP